MISTASSGMTTLTFVVASHGDAMLCSGVARIASLVPRCLASLFTSDFPLSCFGVKWCLVSFEIQSGTL